MFNKVQVASHPSASSAVEFNKVLRNTYGLLSATLLFSGVFAGLSMAFNWPHPGLVITLAGYFGLLFLTRRYRNSALGLLALRTRKDFSFLGGMLFAGILVAFIAGLGAVVFGIPALSLAVSAMFILLMSGLILFQTSQIVHGGETNYVMATITLYIAIYNLFLSLLQILGIFGGDD